MRLGRVGPKILIEKIEQIYLTFLEHTERITLM